jgi:type II secretion system protein C
LSGKTTERRIAAALAVLVAGLGAAVWLGLRPLPPPAAEKPAPAAAQQRRAVPPPSDSDLSLLWRNADPPSAKDKGADATSGLPFQLRGVIFSTPGPSVAFVLCGKTVRLCKAGDMIEGYRLAAIEQDAVMFSKDGRDLRVEMDGRKYDGMPMVARTGGARSDGPAGGQRPPIPVVSLRVGSPAPPAPVYPPPQAAKPPAYLELIRGADASVAVPRNVADRVRQAAAKDPVAALEGVKVTPILQDGQVQGFALNAVPRQSTAGRFGLAAGDRILAVNGQAIDSTARAYELCQRFATSDSVRITLEREGVRKEVVFYVQ